MAVLLRNALAREPNFNESVMENYEMILKEDMLKRIPSSDMTPEEKMEASRKAQQREVKRQLMDRKRRQIVKMSKQLKVNDTFSTILSLLGVVLAFIEAELNYNFVRDNGYAGEDSICYFLRVLVLISTLILLYTIVKHHYTRYKIRRERQTTSEGIGTSFFKSKEFLLMCLELFVNSLICPPGLDIRFEFAQLHGTLNLSLDAVMSSLMLLRVYILIRVVRYYSKWGTVESEDICDSSGCEASHTFMLKGIFKDKPYYILAISMSMSILVFGFAVRTYERPYNDDNGQLQNYDYVWNAMWLVIITMCTVGYGDFYPRTHVGRFVIVIACFWGIFLISMMVVTLTESSEFTKSESRAFEILSRLKRKEEAKKTAAKAVYMALKMNFYLRNSNSDQGYGKTKKIMFDHLKRVLEQFKLEQHDWKQWDLPIEEMLRQLTEKLDVDMEELRNKIYSVVEIDHQLQRVEKFQEESLDATAISMAYLEELLRKLDDVIKRVKR